MRHDLLIIGGGIIGLAVCQKILDSRPQTRVLLLEKEDDVACQQTGHNSGVIHSGIYYVPGTIKAQTCRKGYGLLVDWCRRHDIDYEICGKIVVATHEAELPYLNTLYERGLKNGLQGIRRISAGELRELEPHVAGIAGLHVPETGIVDYRQVAASLRLSCEKNGAVLLFGEEVVNVVAASDGVRVETAKGEYTASCVVSCCGLQSDRIARLTRPDLAVRIIPFRGEYYTLDPAKKYLVRNLIYPVPDPAFPFLGVHFTRLINGEREAGPNAVLALKREGYLKTDVSFADFFETLAWPGFRKIARKYWRSGLMEMYRSFSKKAFLHALQKLVPEVEEADLLPGGSGVRAQACSRDGRLLDDFFFVEDGRLLHVCNAPSPAATASLAIGEQVTERVLAKF
ncbi:MAG: L-2-hydroxyglutarate oxidase [Proteobacteria bacterium]|nr:L-2-hydroxyglutarate oxidase [Pseudomonadota bacterium]MBU0966347.1 L-2-hydroxyglutarate oxidase [Pseudomonadota bacterium]